MSAKNLKLPKNSIHLWPFDLDTYVPHSDQFARHISQDELHRASSFAFEKHSQRFILRRAILRHILSAYIDVTPQEIEFLTIKNGKPVLSEDHKSHIEFNCSHSGNKFITAVASYPVGVDIEKIKEFTDIDIIAQQVMTCKEEMAFKTLSDTEKLDYFFNIWARKEALIKYSGDGLSTDLKNLEALSETEPHETKRGDHHCFTQSFEVYPGYKSALTYTKKNTDILVCDTSRFLSGL